MWVYDLETLAFLAVNDAAIARYGYTEEEFLRMTIKDIRPVDDIPALLDNIAQVTEGLDEAGVWRHRKKDGTLLHVEITSHVLEFNGRRAELVMVTDVTERLWAEQTRVRLQQAIKNSHDVVFITAKDGTITYVNPEFESLYGYTAEEAIGKNPRILKSGKHSAEEYRQFYEVISSGKTLRSEIINRAKDGRLLEIETTVDPIVNPIGEVEGFVAIQRDITGRKRTAEKLAESELRLRQITETIQHVFWMTDPRKNEMIYVSPAYEQIWGRSVQELYRSPRSWMEAIHSDDRDWVLQAALTKQVAGTYNEVYRIVRPDGTIRWIRDRAFPVKNDSGEVYRISGIAADITEYKESELALLESEAKFRTLAQTSAAAIFIYGEKFLYVNPAAQGLTGYSGEEMLKMNFWDIVHPVHRELIRQQGALQLRGENVASRYEFQILRKDGETRWVEFSSGTFRPNGKTYAIGTAFDITDRKRAEEALRESEAFRRLIVDAEPECVKVVAADGTLMEMNPAGLKMIEATSLETVRGKPMISLVAQRFKPAFAALHERVLQGESGKLEFEIVGLQGTRRWLETHAVPLRASSNNIEALLAVTRDITERKLAEERLQQSEARYRDVVENATDIIYLTDINGNFVYANPAGLRLSGYTLDELKQLNYLDLIVPSHKRRVSREYMKQYLRMTPSTTIDFPFRTKSGEIRWFSQASTLIVEDETPTGFRIIARDITDRQLAEEKVKESEERYRELFDEALTGNYVSRPDGTIVACNKTFARIFGYDSPEEAMTRHASDFHKNPEARQKFLDLVRMKKKLEHFEGEARKKDGTVIHIIENVSGKFNDEGELFEIQGQVYDNTERKKLEDHLRHAQKMESIGTLASGIAHDFNNILGIILGHASLLAYDPSQSERVSQSLKAITQATQRGASLVKQMLVFARKTETVLQPLDIRILLKEISQMLKETFPKTIDFRFVVSRDLPLVVGDMTQLHQVILNLCINARDAMPEGGTLTLAAGTVYAHELRYRFRDIRHKAYISISVQDTGHGMEEGVRERIFEPFFTTKAPGRGTGLGLAVVHGIVTAHGGIIDVDSQVGRGSIFHVYLPVQERPLELMPRETSTLDSVRGGTETLLVVEDEETLRSALLNMLKEKGYRVISAGDGEEAIRLFQRHRDELAAIVSDLGLPKIPGDEVLRRVRSSNPTIRTMLVSGYLDPAAKGNLMQELRCEFLQKPYGFEEILRSIRTMLDR